MAGKFVERPDHVFIGHHTYRIEWLDAAEWLANNEDPTNDGITRAAIGLVRLQLVHERPESFYQETLIHELLHTAYDASGATHLSLEKHEDTEEATCLALSPVLLGILKNNPHVVAYLISDGQVVR